MNTNVSKYNGTFADFSPRVPAHKLNVSAKEQGEYLRAYANHFIPGEVLRLSTRVKKVEREKDRWRVISQQEGKEEVRERFDFLVVGTGIFTTPWTPEIPGLENFKGRCIHSFDYDERDPLKGARKIVVVGGRLSGVEVAADLALRVASLLESERSKIEIIHLISKPLWVLPRYMPFQSTEDSAAPGVLPLDLVLFSALKGPDFESYEEQNRYINSMLRQALGSNQEELHPVFEIKGDQLSQPPTFGMSESYGGLLRTGAIKPMFGRLSSVSTDGSLNISKTGEENSTSMLQDIDLIYFATGFTPLKFICDLFPPSLLSELGLTSPSEHPSRFMQSLHNQTLHPVFQNKGAFAGMITTLYPGQLDIQGQYIAGLFTGKYPWPSAEDFADTAKGVAHLFAKHKTKEALVHASRGGYLAWMRHLGDLMGVNTLSLAAAAPTQIKPFIPAYLPHVANTPDAQSTVSSLQNDITHTAFTQLMVARNIFSQLLGNWSINRVLNSTLPGFPSGTFSGTAEFRPRLPTFSVTSDHQITPHTSDLGSLGRDVTEYLYTESGSFTTNNQTFQTTRRYIYKFDSETGGISVWFVKQDGETVDYFFHELDFARKPEVGSVLEDGVDAEGGWKAAAEHLCEEDMYWPAYRFVYRQAQMGNFWVRYKVKGPRKDYVSETVYQRV